MLFLLKPKFMILLALVLAAHTFYLLISQQGKSRILDTSVCDLHNNTTMLCLKIQQIERELLELRIMKAHFKYIEDKMHLFDGHMVTLGTLIQVLNETVALEELESISKSHSSGKYKDL